MTDMCRVFIVGNFATNIVRQRRDDGTGYGMTTLCVGRTDIINGQPRTAAINIPVMVIGTNRVESVAQQFRAGSRVLIEGHLEQHIVGKRSTFSHSSRAGDAQTDALPELVVVIDTILNAAATVTEPEARRQPAYLAWQEGGEPSTHK